MLLKNNPSKKTMYNMRAGCKLLEFSLNGAELPLNSVNSANSGNLRNHLTMN